MVSDNEEAHVTSKNDDKAKIQIESDDDSDDDLPLHELATGKRPRLVLSDDDDE
jgi:hypothetical protein